MIGLVSPNNCVKLVAVLDSSNSVDVRMVQRTNQKAGKEAQSPLICKGTEMTARKEEIDEFSSAKNNFDGWKQAHHVTGQPAIGTLVHLPFPPRIRLKKPFRQLIRTSAKGRKRT